MLPEIEYLIVKRMNYCCDNCGAPFTAYNRPERHHCIEHRDKRFPELDNEINVELVCHKCHASGVVDTTDHAIEFARLQIKRGYDVVDWYNSLPLKTRRFPNLEGML